MRREDNNIKNDDNNSRAVLSIKIDNLNANAERHEVEDNKRFDKIFNFTKESFEKIEKQITTLDVKLSEKVNDLWDSKNKQEGAFGLSKWIAGGVGGLFAVVFGHFWK